MLDANDLSQIKGIVEEVVDAKLDAKLQVVQSEIIDQVDGKIQASKGQMMEEVKAIVLASEDRIVTRINREITDLSEINQAVLSRFDRIPTQSVQRVRPS